jgi:hypothetical protein
MSESKNSAITIELGPDRKVLLKVKIGERILPFELTGAVAADVGVSLLNAAALSSSSAKSGAPLERVALQLEAAQVATHKPTGDAMLALGLLGNRRLIFRLPQAAAGQLGAKLGALCGANETQRPSTLRDTICWSAAG